MNDDEKKLMVEGFKAYARDTSRIKRLLARRETRAEGVRLESERARIESGATTVTPVPLEKIGCRAKTKAELKRLIPDRRRNAKRKAVALCNAIAKHTERGGKLEGYASDTVQELTREALDLCGEWDFPNVPPTVWYAVVRELRRETDSKRTGLHWRWCAEVQRCLLWMMDNDFDRENGWKMRLAQHNADGLSTREVAKIEHVDHTMILREKPGLFKRPPTKKEREAAANLKNRR